MGFSELNCSPHSRVYTGLTPFYAKSLNNFKNTTEQQFREQFRAKWSLWAAVGAGCLVGVSGLLLMQRLSLRVDHSVCIGTSGAASTVSKELASLHSTLKELRQEIQELKSKPPLRYVFCNPRGACDYKCHTMIMEV